MIDGQLRSVPSPTLKTVRDQDGNSIVTGEVPLSLANGGVAERLLDHWQALRAGRTLPSRSDFDPIEVSYALGTLNIVEVTGSDGFVVRLQGTKVREAMGQDMRGMDVLSIRPKIYSDVAIAHYRLATTVKVPILHPIEIHRGYLRQRYLRLLLPFCGPDDGDTVRYLITASDWDRNRITEAFAWLGHNSPPSPMEQSG